jgi:hypothetical protein
MNEITKNSLLWILAIVLTLGMAYYQKTTGPTWPVTGEISIDNNEVGFKLLRSHGGEGGAPVTVEVDDKSVSGEVTFKRYKSYDEWQTITMKRKGEKLVMELPHQPPAGKVEYKVVLKKGNQTWNLSEEPVVLRYKGAVPIGILVPHIFFMFMSMLFGMRILLELVTGGNKTDYLSKVVTISILIGGLILGPIVQKYAFGAYWTGWPFGHDMTDNKTLFMFIFWVIAWWRLSKNPLNRLWPAIAVFVMFAVYLVPHSTLGSEIDYTKEQPKTEQVAE